MGKIRIGILTFQDSANYGALLQAYALQKFLETLEYHVEIINYQSPKRKYCRQTFFKRIRSILWKNTFYKIIKDKERQKKTDYFRNTYLNLSKQLYLDKKTLHLCNDLYDAFIVGSDQVWNSHNTNGDSSYYLDFVLNSKKKIAYAPSFGRTQISDSEKIELGKNLKDFTAISTREKSGAKILETILQQDISIMIDPVFLLSRSQWNRLINFYTCKAPYILCYFMPGNKIIERKIESIAEQLGETTGYEIINVGKKDYARIFYRTSDCFGNGPLEFISLIKNAKFVITNSFHGTAFSIIYHKIFWVPVFKEMDGGGVFNTRILEMLDYFSLSDRAIDVNERNVDYTSIISKGEEIDNKIVKSRIEAINYLEKSLRSSNENM